MGTLDPSTIKPGDVVTVRVHGSMPWDGDCAAMSIPGGPDFDIEILSIAPAPEPLKVGDTVQWGGGLRTIWALHGEFAWISSANNSVNNAGGVTVRVSDLERIP